MEHSSAARGGGVVEVDDDDDDEEDEEVEQGKDMAVRRQVSACWHRREDQIDQKTGKQSQ